MATKNNGNQLRQRNVGGSTNNKKKSKTKKAPAAAAKVEAVAEPPPVPIEDQSAAQILLSHWSLPLYGLAALAALVYGLYWSYYWLMLQRPDLLPSLNLRPPLALTEPRQLLIVGTMSSGTSQVAHDLQSMFQLEIGHETSESQWNFVRDGTVSWFHGIRFLSKDTEPEFAQSIVTLCHKLLPNMGFHPRMFRDDSGCSTREQWSQCWQRECIGVLNQEWGCGLESSSSDEDGKESGCVSPFQTVLHQVRHPLRTLESMLVKFCQGGGTKKDETTGKVLFNNTGTLHKSFATVGNGLFRQHNFTQYSCVEGVAQFILEYHKAMMQVTANDGASTTKKSSSFPIAARYPVETTTPCQILQLAGFFDAAEAAYPLHIKRLLKVCQDKDHVANQPMSSSEYQVNQGDLRLTWGHLERMDQAIVAKEGSAVTSALQALTKELGYDVGVDQQIEDF